MAHRQQHKVIYGPTGRRWLRCARLAAEPHSTERQTVEIAAAAAQCRDIFLSSDAGSQATHAREEEAELPPLLAAVMGILQRLRDTGRLPSLTPAAQAIDMTVRKWAGGREGVTDYPPTSCIVTAVHFSSCLQLSPPGPQDRLTLVPRLITLPDVERRLALGEYATVGSFIVDIRRLLAGIRCYSHLAPGSEVRCYF